jgi:hypothetical protein
MRKNGTIESLVVNLARTAHINVSLSEHFLEVFTPCVRYFACPGIDTQVQGISVLCLIQRMRQLK